MKEIVIDCAGVSSRQELHKLLAEALHFPQWYGSNLDALHDCLCAISVDSRLVLTNWGHIASFAHPFRRVLEDAEKENFCFEVSFR